MTIANLKPLSLGIDKTAQPWRYIIREGERVQVAEMNPHRNPFEKRGSVEDVARLFIAAPDMLAALERIIGTLEADPNDGSNLGGAMQAMLANVRREAAAAIAKATGEA